MAAVTTLPQSEAHEGHDGHDHGETLAAPQESLQQTRSPDSDNEVVTTPPPFETLDSKPGPLLDPPLTTPSERIPRQRQEGPNDRFGKSNPNAGVYDVPRLDSEDGQSFSQTSPDAFDLFAREAYGEDGRGLDRFSLPDTAPSRPRFNRSMSECESGLYLGGPRDTCGYGHADRYCATEAPLPYTTISSCYLADVGYHHSYSPRTDYRQHRDVFHCPGATDSCDSLDSQLHY